MNHFTSGSCNSCSHPPLQSMLYVAPLIVEGKCYYGGYSDIYQQSCGLSYIYSSPSTDFTRVCVCEDVGHIDADSDGYYSIVGSEYNDCDDNNPNVNPGVIEVCDTSYDDDCDGLVNCDDPDCDEYCNSDYDYRLAICESSDGYYYDGHCWFLGEEAQSCDEVCSSHGSHCLEGSWSDDKDCTILNHFVDCETCYDQTSYGVAGALPFLQTRVNGWGLRTWKNCYTRGSTMGPQDCSASRETTKVPDSKNIYNLYKTYRLCVCE